MTRATQRAELQNIIGPGAGGLSDAEANSFLYEGLVALCVRSEWTRKRVQLGPTVAGQFLYPLPTEVDRPLKVYLDDVFLKPSSEETAQSEVEQLGRLHFHRAVWYLDDDEDGNVSVAVYPTPTESGLELRTAAVVYPPEPTDTSALPVPPDFERAPIAYAAAKVLGGGDDNREIHDSYMAEFDHYVLGLYQRRNSRTGRGPRQMKIAAIGGTA